MDRWLYAKMPGDSGFTIYSDGPAPYDIAVVSPCGGEDEANAPLLAAAPMLRLALSNLSAAADPFTRSPRDVDLEVLKAALSEAYKTLRLATK